MTLTIFFTVTLIAILAGLLLQNNVVALCVFATGLFLFSVPAKAETYYKFTYKNNLSVSVPAASYQEAFMKASKECFQIQTKGQYQSEEFGLNVIDDCSNPGGK